MFVVVVVVLFCGVVEVDFFAALVVRVKCMRGVFREIFFLPKTFSI